MGRKDVYTKGKISGGKGLVEKRKVANDKDGCYLPVSQHFFLNIPTIEVISVVVVVKFIATVEIKENISIFLWFFCAQKHKTIKEENDGANTFRMNSLFSAVLKDYYWKIPSC